MLYLKTWCSETEIDNDWKTAMSTERYWHGLFLACWYIYHGCINKRESCTLLYVPPIFFVCSQLQMINKKLDISFFGNIYSSIIKTRVSRPYEEFSWKFSKSSECTQPNLDIFKMFTMGPLENCKLNKLNNSFVFWCYCNFVFPFVFCLSLFPYI